MQGPKDKKKNGCVSQAFILFRFCWGLPTIRSTYSTGHTACWSDPTGRRLDRGILLTPSLGKPGQCSRIVLLWVPISL